MGFDLHGKAPASEAGKAFHRNVWGWRPLAAYLTDTFPALTSYCHHWQSNDGDGLTDRQANDLADAIREQIHDGHAQRYVAAFKAQQAAIADEPCPLCKGTGTRSDLIGHQMGMVEKKWCNGCSGKGQRPPIDKAYWLDFDTLVEFAAFCRNSGGFEIW